MTLKLNLRDCRNTAAFTTVFAFQSERRSLDSPRYKNDPISNAGRQCVKFRSIMRQSLGKLKIKSNRRLPLFSPTHGVLLSALFSITAHADYKWPTPPKDEPAPRRRFIPGDEGGSWSGKRALPTDDDVKSAVDFTTTPVIQEMRVTADARLTQEASKNSPTTAQLSKGDRVTLSRKSPSGAWGFVSSSKGRGWIPLQMVKPIESGSESMSSEDFVKSFNDLADQAPDRLALTMNDRDLTTFLAAQKGRLSEEPSANSATYGIIEEGDELMLLSRSDDGEWSRVRLKITGEEGWYPSRWVRREDKPRIDQGGLFTLEFAGAYGIKGFNFGFGGGIGFNLTPKGFQDRPRDRLDLMFEGFQFMGESQVSTSGASLVANYTAFFTGFRYVFNSPDGFFSGNAELGAAYTMAKVTVSGLSSDVLASSGLQLNPGGFAFMGGILGSAALSRFFHVYAGPRFMLGSSSRIVAFAGIMFRF